MAQPSDPIGVDIRNHLVAAGVAVLVALLVGGFALMYPSVAQRPEFRLLAFGYAVAAFLFGASQLKKANARIFGRRCEKRAIAAAAKTLPRYGIVIESSDTPAPGIGDVDMVVTCAGRTLPVEIKSFASWDARDDRCQHAIHQTMREAGAVGADRGIIWLPRGRAGFWTAGRGIQAAPNIAVALGSARNLAKVIRRIAA